MRRCPEYIIGVGLLVFELHNAIKVRLIILTAKSLSFFVVNRFPICCTSLKKKTAAITKRGVP